MKCPLRSVLAHCLLLLCLPLPAQHIQFEPVLEDALSAYAQQRPRVVGHCTDSLRTDTIHVEDVRTGALQLHVRTYPFARYEFYVDDALYRRVDIDQRTDTREVGWKPDLATGDTIGVIQAVTLDIPNGAYHEFFPNGNIRIKGTLDGYDPDGTLKKTGEWTEWDEHGKLVRRETYP